jgi:hypothetical protein
MAMRTYPEMNAKIVEILRMTAEENPATAYAAVRIEELEAINAELFAACESLIRGSLFYSPGARVWYCAWCLYSAPEKEGIQHRHDCAVGKAIGTCNMKR